MSPTTDPVRVLLAGDSTVAACPAHETPMSGWGPHLAAPLNAALGARAARADQDPRPVHVLNTAKGGATTESHRDEGLWAALLAELRAGDVVVLQFGHNDQKQQHLAAGAGYTELLERACAEVLAAGASPVLCTPVERRRWVDGVQQSTHGDHPRAVRGLATRLGLSCIDLTAATTALYQRLGEDGSAALFTHLPPGSPLWPDGCADDTHFSFTGAVQVAELVAAALVQGWDELEPQETP
ncbi:rhamnogalacturonan acetylesterase [Auraticoccus monumenti]|uniref:Lysophospholipase L1 n=1 Tax=Auraticoccus monumenti TaxID=675864 RepID=A0A1G6W7Q0_9ACTN|nr:rhamnogalacturonan acetylesterase [Auraticoccus monumenti]SDD61970.1 Lysophospholipase L1 [Auraticoccus monumenti]